MTLRTSDIDWRTRRADEARLAAAYLRTNPSTLIDMALAQRWSKSLEDLVRSVIRQCWDRDGAPPTPEMLTRFRLPDEDVDYYRRHGQPHLITERDEIRRARAKIRATSREAVP